jgi:lipoyl(octanoyl) transferase
MGVRASRWVTMHGFALNVNVDLNYFNNIIPCGLANNIVTSISNEKNMQEIDIINIKQSLKKNFSEVFKADFI